MEVGFKTNRLRRNYEESSRAVQDWGEEVARKYIIRVNELRRIEDLNGAYQIRAMRLHPLKGDRRGRLSIRLTGRWRLIVTRGDTEESVIIEEVSNHYGD